jgi:nucleoside-diphosphate-sugar epimerase
MNKILVTGATGKVGQVFIERILENRQFDHFKIRAFCHKRKMNTNERLEVVYGSVDNRDDVMKAMEGITHVLHLATSKETPDTIMDISVKGLFWLLECCRTSRDFKQFILIGGDASVGHFFYPRSEPVTETQYHSAYPGCYALSKVLEEVMLEQYYIQYDLNGCCLRAPWIMEKDDFKYQLSFGEDVFGGPFWRDLVGKENAEFYQKEGRIPIMLDPEGIPVKRNFVHVDDLADAILLSIDNPKARQQTFNICMNEPVDYGELASYLGESRQLLGVEIKTEYFSTWLDNNKARFILGWQPEYDLKKMADAAWDYVRADNDPRKVWYPG